MTIIKYYEWLRIIPDERHVIYELCKRDPESDDGVRKIRNLDKQTALKMIEENTLRIVCKNKHGIIWA